MCDTLTTKIIGQRFSNLNGISRRSADSNCNSSLDTYFTNNHINSTDKKKNVSVEEVDNTTSKINNVSSGNTLVPDYTKEEDRISSFKNWTNTHISPESLAKAGFYFIQRGDAVRCAFCKVEGHCWMPQDDPMADHKQWMPRCPFLQQNTCTHRGHNNAGDNLPSDTNETSNRGQDVYGILEVFPNSLPEDATIGELQSLSIQRPKKPYNCAYKTEESRLCSYKKWPIALKQRPDEMARAGFYYLGSGDEVICYYCGGGLHDWKECDDPWEQHARWFPKCTYLLMEKGREYVDTVRRNAFGTVESVSPSSATTTKEINDDASSASSSSGVASEKGLCKICYKNDVRLVFRPCEHALTCVACGLAVDKCPVCRKSIERVDRMVLS